MWRPCLVTMGRIISFGWMQMRMSIRDVNFLIELTLWYLQWCIRACLCAHRYTYKDTPSQTHAHRHTLTTGSFSSIYGQEMGVVLCLVELSNTILSHIGLTSNTSDKPILFLSTESSPCPKITLLSLGTQQRRMVSRGVDSSLWHLQYAWKGK